MEVLGFKTTNEINNLLNSFFDDSLVIELTNEIVNETIVIRKNFKIKLPDAIIASTALVNKLKLITRNTSDFKSIESLKVINPYDI